MTYYPRIYVFNGFPVKGEMGDLTDIEIKEVCEVCHRKELIEHKLSYKFDEWGGEDIIKGSGFHLFSSRIKDRIELELIKGVSFKEVENEKSDYFRINKKAYQKKLPIFYKLEIHNILDGPEIWFKREEVCVNCKDQKWDSTEEGIASSITFDPYEEYTALEVFKKDWNGEDLFLLKDYGPPIITEKLLNIIRESTNQKIELREAKWR